MGLFKRVIASISRKKDKTALLLILITLLISIIAGSIAIQFAVIRTEENLRRRMPPIATIELDNQRWREHVNETGVRHTEPSNLTADQVRQIGKLPYISHFNYSISSSLQSFDFDSYVPEIEGNAGSSDVEGYPTFIEVIGVSRPGIIYIEQGLIELVDGRTFEESEMNGATDIIPIVLSQPLANANNVSTGSTIVLNSMIPSVFDNDSPAIWQIDELYANEEYTFQIVGLFDMVDRRNNLSIRIDEDFNEWNHQWRTLNTVYIPSFDAEAINRFSFGIVSQLITESGFDDPWLNPDGAFEDSHVANIDAIFVLECSLKMNDFKIAVEPLIPSYYQVIDLSNSFASMQSSMETMLWIGDIVFIIALTATILILNLVITLFLRDRQFEIGVYLALGEKRLRVILQIILETFAISVIGITLAVFIGSVVFSQLSQMLLHQQLVAQIEPETRIMGFDGTRNLETLGFLVEMSPDEMMESFDISLNGQTISLLYGIGIITVVISTLIPVVYITRLNPKKILMDAK